MIGFVDVMAKTGRRGKGDDREPKSARIAAAVTPTEKRKLEWLAIHFGLSIADLIGWWIESSFQRAGGLMQDGEVVDPPSTGDRLLDFLLKCDRSEPIGDDELLALADELAIAAELLIRFRERLGQHETTD